jgi:hypothetical protein
VPVLDKRLLSESIYTLGFRFVGLEKPQGFNDEEVFLCESIVNEESGDLDGF